MTFVYTIHPTSFDYGSLLNVNEQMFQILPNRSAYNDRHNGKFNKHSSIMCFCIV